MHIIVTTQVSSNAKTRFALYVPKNRQSVKHVTGTTVCTYGKKNGTKILQELWRPSLELAGYQGKIAEFNIYPQRLLTDVSSHATNLKSEQIL